MTQTEHLQLLGHDPPVEKCCPNCHLKPRRPIQRTVNIFLFDIKVCVSALNATLKQRPCERETSQQRILTLLLELPVPLCDIPSACRWPRCHLEETQSGLSTGPSRRWEGEWWGTPQNLPAPLPRWEEPGRGSGGKFRSKHDLPAQQRIFIRLRNHHGLLVGFQDIRWDIIINVFSVQWTLKRSNKKGPSAGDLEGSTKAWTQCYWLHTVPDSWNRGW